MTGSFSEQVTCAAFPVRLEGEVDGASWYFRAHLLAWSFGVGATPGAAAQAAGGDGSGFGRGGEYRDPANPAIAYAAGYMPLDEARALIARCVAEYRAESR